MMNVEEVADGVGLWRGFEEVLASCECAAHGFVGSTPPHDMNVHVRSVLTLSGSICRRPVNRLPFAPKLTCCKGKEGTSVSSHRRHWHLALFATLLPRVLIHPDRVGPKHTHISTPGALQRLKLCPADASQQETVFQHRPVFDKCICHIMT